METARPLKQGILLTSKELRSVLVSVVELEAEAEAEAEARGRVGRSSSPSPVVLPLCCCGLVRSRPVLSCLVWSRVVGGLFLLCKLQICPALQKLVWRVCPTAAHRVLFTAARDWSARARQFSGPGDGQFGTQAGKVDSDYLSLVASCKRSFQSPLIQGRCRCRCRCQCRCLVCKQKIISGYLRYRYLRRYASIEGGTHNNYSSTAEHRDSQYSRLVNSKVHISQRVTRFIVENCRAVT